MSDEEKLRKDLNDAVTAALHRAFGRVVVGVIERLCDEADTLGAGEELRAVIVPYFGGAKRI